MNSFSLTFLLICILSALSFSLSERMSMKVLSGDEQPITNWEALFLELPNGTLAKSYLQYYTSIPHSAGTIGDFETANYTLNKFKEFGLNNSEIVSFEVLLSFPKNRVVQMLSPTTYVATLEEIAYPQDPSTSDPRVIPTFNGYAPSGNVTGELVYLNYGSFEDFEYLQQNNIDLKGKIGIARYGNIFRGTKAMIAQQYGIIGLLIYSDPINDGFSRGTVFPDGPWRPATGVQRGSAQFISLCPGDPRRTVCTTPDNVNNYNWTQMIPSIPVQPISWQDALPLLQQLNSSTPAPSPWQGGLNITYMIGPGPAVVNMDIEIEFNVSTIWDVIATIDGEDPARTVLMGNHRDAWVFGAADPNSGSSVLLDVARSYGLLLQKGWKPKRNIILASWDGEEYGLLGSTAWAEANAPLLQKTAMAYINVDTAVTGPWLVAGATPSLEHVMHSASKQIIDPNSGKPLSQVWDGTISTLGSGSDYTSFLDHLGIPSSDFGFKGDYGVYHSVYDDFYWMTHFGDPDFKYHEACAQYWGLLGMKFSESTVLPYNYTIYAQRMNDYFADVQTRLQKANHTIDLSQLQSAIQAFQASAHKVEQQITAALDIHSSFSATDLANLNDRLMYTERSFLSSAGLPKRPYYKHVIQAPGLYKGYGATTFPGLVQSIDDLDWTTFQSQYQTLWKQISVAAVTLGG